MLRARATQPAGEVGVREVIGRRFAMFPQPDRTDAEWASWWADHFDVLADLSVGALEAAMQAWVKLPDAEFLPKPGKLRELALTTPSRAVGAYQRAKAAMEYVPPRTYDPTAAPGVTPRILRTEPTAEEKRVAKLGMDAFRAVMSAKKSAAEILTAPPTPAPDKNDPGLKRAMALVAALTQPQQQLAADREDQAA